MEFLLQKVASAGRTTNMRRRLDWQVCQPMRGELNPGGLAGQMLCRVLIRIVRKCFIAWKSLEGRELCKCPGEE
jgi:hypothetical protein